MRPSEVFGEQALAVRLCGSKKLAVAHHLERRERRRLAPGAPPPPDGEREHHGAHQREPTRSEEHAGVGLALAEGAPEDSTTNDQPTRHPAIVADPSWSDAFTPDFGQAGGMEVVWFLLAVALMVGLAWLGYQIEPHHVSKDGRRILCNAQLLSEHGEQLTRWRETKVLVLDDNRVVVEQRRFLRRRSGLWKVVAESDAPPRRRAVFLLRNADPVDGPEMLALRLPASSRGNDILRAQLAA